MRYSIVKDLAEARAVKEGFEPPDPVGPPTFQAGAISHSATPPKIGYKDSNLDCRDQNPLSCR